jgi:hypothetical protein
VPLEVCESHFLTVYTVVCQTTCGLQQPHCLLPCTLGVAVANSVAVGQSRGKLYMCCCLSSGFYPSYQSSCTQLLKCFATNCTDSDCRRAYMRPQAARLACERRVGTNMQSTACMLGVRVYTIVVCCTSRSESIDSNIAMLSH